MQEYQIDVYNVNTFETIDTFIAEFSSICDILEFMDNKLHNYNEPFHNLSYFFTGAHIKE